jgi:ferrous iron transport protein A
MQANFLKPGESSVIVSISPDCPVKNKMLDFGFIKGSEIKIIKKLSFGDPVEVSVRGSYIALRKKDLSYVTVRGADNE